LHNMVVESRRESYIVSDYLNTGHRWYASGGQYRQVLHSPS
jgi:hypothetical protein